MRIETSRILAVQCSILLLLCASSAPAGGDGGTAYVTNRGGNSVAVVDLESMQPVGSPIGVGFSPTGCVLNPAGTRLYVANFLSNSVSVINTATNAVVNTIPTTAGGPWGVAITPDGAKLYVTLRNADMVSVISTAAGAEIGTVVVPTVAPGPVPGAGAPQAIAITPDGTKIIVANNVDATIAVISTLTDTVTAGPLGVALNPRVLVTSADSSKVLVAGNVVDVYDLVTNTSIDAEAGPGASSSGAFEAGTLAGSSVVLTGNFGDPSPSPLYATYDFGTGTLSAPQPLVGATASGVAATADLGCIYVLFQGSETLSEFNPGGDLGSPRIAGTGKSPVAIAAVLPTPPINPPLPPPPGTTVDSFFLPQKLRLQLRGAERDTLSVSGAFDDGGADVDYSAPVTVRVGGYERTVTLALNGRKTNWSFSDDTLRLRLKPNVRGASRGVFRLRVKGTSLTGLVDPDAPVELRFGAGGLPEASSAIRLSRGRFRLGKPRGALDAPAAFPLRAKLNSRDSGTDAFTLVLGFPNSGDVPESLDTVHIGFGEFAQQIDGALVERKGDAYYFTQSGVERRVSVVLDFRRGLATIKARGVEVGALDQGMLDVSVDLGTGAGGVTTTVRLGTRGSKRVY